MPPILKFKLPEGYDGGQLIRKLNQDYRIKKEPRRDTSFVIYDTFDWRLYNKSLCLYSSGNTLFLRKLFQTEIVHSHEFSALPVFIADFPAGALKEVLTPIIKARALLRLVEVYGRSRLNRILNPDNKTVARLIYEEFRLSSGENAPALTAHIGAGSVKGYPKYCRHLTQRLQQTGFKICREDVYFKALVLKITDLDFPDREASRLIIAWEGVSKAFNADGDSKKRAAEVTDVDVMIDPGRMTSLILNF